MRVRRLNVIHSDEDNRADQGDSSKHPLETPPQLLTAYTAGQCQNAAGHKDGHSAPGNQKRSVECLSKDSRVVVHAHGEQEPEIECHDGRPPVPHNHYTYVGYPGGDQARYRSLQGMVGKCRYKHGQGIRNQADQEPKKQGPSVSNISQNLIRLPVRPQDKRPRREETQFIDEISIYRHIDEYTSPIRSQDHQQSDSAHDKFRHKDFPPGQGPA